MAERPTVGLALIARDEARFLPGLLASIEGAFDQVVLLDTGSRDQTRQIFHEWALAEQRRAIEAGRTFWTRSDEFDWCEDFAAAREAADALLTTDWRCWADCDDELLGADQLRAIAAEAPEQVGAVFFRYDYAQDPESGACICELWRERLVRRGLGRWAGRVHESIDFGATGVLQIDPGRCQWKHRKPPGEPPPRNLDILQAWIRDEPDNERVVGYLGVELAGRGRHEEALEAYARYLALHPDVDDHRLQTRRRMCASLGALGRVEEIPPIALGGVAENPAWADSYLSLAEAAYTAGEYGKAIEFANEVLRRGKPTSLLIVNPLDYTLGPLMILAGAHGALGQPEEACRHAEQALQINPANADLVGQLQHWRSVAKRDHSVSTWLACAEMLCRHDEQLKALTLLEQTCPYFIVDHPAIVEARSRLRERLGFVRDQGEYAAMYRDGGPKPEQLVADGDIDRICRALPRAGFLANGLRELDQERAAA